MKKFVQGELFSNESKSTPKKGVEPSKKVVDISVPEGMIVDDDGVTKSIGNAVAEEAIKKSDSPTAVAEARTIGSVLDNQIQTMKANPVGNPLAESIVGTEAQGETPVMGLGKAMENLPTIPTEPVEFPQTPPRPIGSIYDPYAVEQPTVITEGLGDVPQSGLTDETRAAYQKYLIDRGQGSALNPRANIAIERMNVQDYFPNQHNIAVGSYSRKTLGSGNIYVAGGAIVPMGIIDARKRKLEEQAIKRKETLDAALQWSMETAPQYEQMMNADTADMFREHYDLVLSSGGDPNDLLNPLTPVGASFQKLKKDREALYKAVSDTDKLARKMIQTDLNEKNRFVPEEALILAKEYIDGKEGFITDHENGLRHVSELNSMLQSYENLSTFANGAVERYQASNPEKRFINLKDGIDPTKHADKISEAVKWVPGRDYDKMYKATSEFYDASNVRDYVDAAFENNNFYTGLSNMSKEEREAIIDKGKAQLFSMIMNQLTEQVNLDVETVNNKNFEYYEEANKQARWKAQQDQNRTKYDVVSDQMQWTNQRVQNILNRPGLSTKQKEEQIAILFRNNFNYDPEATRYFGTSANKIELTDEEKDREMYGNAKNMMIVVTDLKLRQKVNVSLRAIASDPKRYYSNDFKISDLVKDYNTLQKLSPSGQSVAFKPAGRWSTLGVDNGRGQYKPATQGKQGDKVNTVLNTELDKFVYQPIIDPKTGQQKVNDKTGQYEWNRVRLYGKYYIQSNGDDEVVQSTFDVRETTSQINSNSAFN
jgi:predicted Holliday junction resolvase-like endonuclease